MIVLDASVLIAHLGVSDEHHGRATELMLETAHESLGASPLTLAEVFVGPARVGKLARAQAAVGSLGIATIALATDAPSRLAQLRAATRLPLPACCVLLAAEASGGQIATFDHRLASAASRLGMTARP